MSNCCYFAATIALAHGSITAAAAWLVLLRSFCSCCWMVAMRMACLKATVCSYELLFISWHQGGNLRFCTGAVEVALPHCIGVLARGLIGRRFRDARALPRAFTNIGSPLCLTGRRRKALRSIPLGVFCLDGKYEWQWVGFGILLWLSPTACWDWNRFLPYFSP